jgi:hypothetical protein
VTTKPLFKSQMQRRWQGGVVGLGSLGVMIVLVVGGLILWNYWDELADWAKVVLLMVWGTTLAFGELIALAIDSDNDSQKP